MTIDELEQGLRNLIATQPMVMTGANGGVINGVLSMIDSLRNLNFRVQTYPIQDSLKFNLSNDVNSLDNNFVGYVFRVLQERGINLNLYLAGGMQYGQAPIAPNMVMGNMSYQPVMQNPMMSGQSMMAAAPSMMGYGQPSGAPTLARRQRSFTPNPPPIERIQPAQPVQPVKLEPSINEVPMQSVGVNNKPIDEEPRVSIAKPEINKTAAVKSTKPSPAEMLMGESDGAPAGKAAGRDYLLELLKK
ncbi:MAG: hypothetical protein IJ538_02555 [Clostridia bacterium]|nr:hypothetical protein [Clostridia bacterium]